MGLGASELVLILLLVVLLFGASKIPALGKSVGEGLSNFKRGLREGSDDPPPPPDPPKVTVVAREINPPSAPADPPRDAPRDAPRDDMPRRVSKPPTMSVPRRADATLGTTAMPPSGRRTTIELLGDCNNACVFCAQAGLPARSLTGDALTHALTAARAEGDELTFIGGEPTLRDDLAEVITAARALGFRRVGIQTNARRLDDRTYVRVLTQAGLTDVHVSLHGVAAVHDYHTGVPGSFGTAAVGIATATAAGLTVVATTVLTRSNCRVLSVLPGVLASRGVAAWNLSVPVVAGRARADFDRVVPRLAIALPFANHALRTARDLRPPLVAWISGAPLCLLGPYAGHALPTPPRAYGTACAPCPARAVCPGVDPAYLARFAGDELSPRPPPPGPAYVGDRAAMLARMFVGVGALASDTGGMLPLVAGD